MTHVSWRRILVLVVPPVAALGVLVTVATPSGLTGSTRCLPMLGPKIDVDPALTGKDRALALAHETAHATQCRDQGALRNYMARLTRAGRLAAELNAYCAEGIAEVRMGGRPELVVARVLDELEEGYRWFRGTTRSEFLGAFASACPSLVREARARARRPLASAQASSVNRPPSIRRRTSAMTRSGAA